MIYDYARVPTDCQSVDAQVGQFREVATCEPQLRARL